MMRATISRLVVLAFSFLMNFSQLTASSQDVKFETENRGSETILYVTNPEITTVSLELTLDLSNMKFSEGRKSVFVVPPSIYKMKLGTLTISDIYFHAQYSYTYKVCYGDVNLRKFNRDYEYSLPFAKGDSFRVIQGYNGNFSHQGQNSLDFGMPLNSVICAVRNGTVVKVVQHNNTGCASISCVDYNNYIIIEHPDGTYAEYAHILQNGALVRKGDDVSAGQAIARSGNTGFSSVPHLHLEIYVPSFDKAKRLPTKFKIESGEQTAVLEERKTYSKLY